MAGQGRVRGHMVQGWTKKSAWIRGTELDKEECVDIWYTAGQGRVHGHVVQGWTKKQDLPIVPCREGLC